METFIAVALIATLLVGIANAITNYQMKRLIYKIRKSEQERQRKAKTLNALLKSFLIGMGSLFASRSFSGVFNLFNGDAFTEPDSEEDDDDDFPNGTAPHFAMT